MPTLLERLRPTYRNWRVRLRPLAVPGLVVLSVALLGWAITDGPAAPLPKAPERTPPAEPESIAAQPETPPPAAEAAPLLPARPAVVEADSSGDDEELLRTCERIAAKLASVSFEDCAEGRLALSGARSTRGVPILVAEYPPLPAQEPLGRVLLFGGIHGDELSSVSIVYRWMRTLDRYHSGLFHWRIAPLVNPDGLLRDKPQRMNDRGVDLNRNFPSPNWAVDAPDYWIRRTSRNPRRYPGEAPLSEPESRWLHEQIETFRPHAIVAVHAPSCVVDYDGPPEAPDRLGPLVLNQLGTYPGSLGRFAGSHLGLPVVTIELPSAGIMPSIEDQRHMWVDLVAWLRHNVPRQPGARLAQAAPPAARGAEAPSVVSR